MTCRRCQGLMVEDYLFDVQNPSGEVWVSAWRCINCGAMQEAMMELNRHATGAGDRREGTLTALTK